MKYVALKAAFLVVFVIYGLWLYNQLRFDEPELREPDNLMSIFWAVIVIGFAAVVIGLGFFRSELWPLIIVGTIFGVLSFQKFMALVSDDSWRMTYLCLIAIALFIMVLPLDKVVLAKFRERRKRKGATSEKRPHSGGATRFDPSEQQHSHHAAAGGFLDDVLR